MLFYIFEIVIGFNDVIYFKGDNGVGKIILLKIFVGLLELSNGRVFGCKFWW